MEVYLDAQLRQLAWALAFGAGAGIVFDFIRIIGNALGNRKRHAAKDVLFWSVTILAVFFFNVALFSGETSFFFPFAMGVGGLIYLHLARRYICVVFETLVFPLKVIRKFAQERLRRLGRWFRRRRQAVKMRIKMRKMQKSIENAVENTK